MNMIYDIVLNYERVEDSYESYEWSKNDYFTYIEKIPIIKIDHKDMKKCFPSRFQISKKLLQRIENKTISSEGKNRYSTLLTDGFRVVAFTFDEKGITKEKSSLLLDEEEAVIMEAESFPKEKFTYDIIEEYPITFLTRKEKKLQKNLLKKIKELYQKKNYDEIDYLYHECFFKRKSPEEEYEQLIKNIENQLEEKYESLCEIIELAES